MINRRDFMVAGLSAGATTALFSVTDFNCLPPEKATTSIEQVAPTYTLATGLGEKMDTFLLSLEGTEQVGKAWVTSFSTPPTLAQTAQAVGARIKVDAGDLPAITSSRILKDFSENKLCELNGWKLSLMECQLAGLRHLAIEANPENLKISTATEKMSLIDQLTPGIIAPLNKWGPQSTTEGKKFNEQRDGHSGMWFQFDGAPSHAKIMIDGQLLKTAVNEKVLTSGLFGEMQDRILATPGSYEVALVDPIRKIKQPIGELVIKADPSKRETGFCEVTKWGPQRTVAGTATNPQPDGSMGIWAHTDCLPEKAQLLLVDDRLELSPRKFGFVSSIPLALLETPGKKPLIIYDEVSKKKHTIGFVTIE